MQHGTNAASTHLTNRSNGRRTSMKLHASPLRCGVCSVAIRWQIGVCKSQLGCAHRPMAMMAVMLRHVSVAWHCVVQLLCMATSCASRRPPQPGPPVGTTVRKVHESSNAIAVQYAAQVQVQVHVARHGGVPADDRKQNSQAVPTMGARQDPQLHQQHPCVSLLPSFPPFFPARVRHKAPQRRSY